jgi:hypothetical protein
MQKLSFEKGNIERIEHKFWNLGISFSLEQGNSHGENGVRGFNIEE